MSANRRMIPYGNHPEGYTGRSLRCFLTECPKTKQSGKFRFIALLRSPLRRGAHCASDNHQELVVVKNVSFFGEITSFSVVFVFMPFRHEPDAQCAPLRRGKSNYAINRNLPLCLVLRHSVRKHRRERPMCRSGNHRNLYRLTELANS